MNGSNGSRPRDYKYRARAADGGVVTGVLEAAAPEDIERALQMQGMEAIEIKPSRAEAFRRQLQVGKGFRLEDRILFCRQLGTFTRSGLPILAGMHIMAEQARTPVLRKAYAKVAAALERGQALSEAMLAERRVFPRLMIDLVRAAEQTGNLDAVLAQLDRHYERELSVQRKIRQALTYPAVIVLMALAAVIVLVAYVLPGFVKLFQEFDQQLPVLARLMLGVSKFASTKWPFLLAGLAIFGTLGVLFFRSEPGKRLLHRIALRMPVVAPIAEAAIVSRWARTLGGMVRAGVPMDRALEVTRLGISNTVYRARLRDVSSRVVEGEGMAGPLAATGLFPDMVVQMVRVSEETGSLEEHLDHLADYYEDELKYRIDKAISFLEPTVLIGVGIGVGLVAVSMVSTMYGLTKGVK